VEVVDELVAEFRKLEERWSRLERLSMRIYNLLLGSRAAASSSAAGLYQPVPA
jgi:hypothetical protein